MHARVSARAGLTARISSAITNKLTLLISPTREGCFDERTISHHGLEIAEASCKVVCIEAMGLPGYDTPRSYAGHSDRSHRLARRGPVIEMIAQGIERDIHEPRNTPERDLGRCAYIEQRYLPALSLLLQFFKLA